MVNLRQGTANLKEDKATQPRHTSHKASKVHREVGGVATAPCRLPLVSRASSVVSFSQHRFDQPPTAQGRARKTRCPGCKPTCEESSQMEGSN